MYGQALGVHVVFVSTLISDTCHIYCLFRNKIQIENQSPLDVATCVSSMFALGYIKLFYGIGCSGHTNKIYLVENIDSVSVSSSAFSYFVHSAAIKGQVMLLMF